MDAPATTTPGDAATAAEDRELSSLRRRAYGPDADIAGDPTAVARLAQLEASHAARRIRPRTSAPAPTPLAFGPHDTAPNHTAAEHNSSEHITPAHTAPQHTAPRDTAPHDTAPPADRSVPADSAPPENAPTRRLVRAWRRTPRWMLLGLGLIVGAIIVGVLSTAGSGSFDTTLAPRSDQDTDGRQVFREYGSLDYLGVEMDDLTLYDEFRGLDIWTAPSMYGTQCLIITDGGDDRRGGLWGGNCTPAGMAPTVDLQNFSAFDHEVFDNLPIGSIVRFVLEDDRVRVSVGEALEGGEPFVQQP